MGNPRVRFSKTLTWLGKHVDLITAIVTAIGVGFVAIQLYQVNEQQKWGNYNQLNLHYSSLYREIKPELHFTQCRTFSQLSDESRQWIRSYFDLYSEEHWLYLQDLIPEEMWTLRIDGGVDVNLITYPVLAEGYEYWKGLGAFHHPPEFIPWVDKKMETLREKIQDSIKTGCDRNARLAFNSLDERL